MRGLVPFSGFLRKCLIPVCRTSPSQCLRHSIVVHGESDNQVRGASGRGSSRVGVLRHGARTVVRGANGKRAEGRTVYDFLNLGPCFSDVAVRKQQRGEGGEWSPASRGAGGVQKKKRVPVLRDQTG